MIPFEVKLDQGQHDGGQPIWDDLTDHTQYVKAEGGWKLATLRNGTAGGRASIMLRLEIPGGGVVIAETSARAFLAAAKMVEAAHGSQGDQ